MSSLSKRSFAIYTIGLLFIWLVVVIYAENNVESTNAASESSSSWRFSNPAVDKKNERNCKSLCEHCGCLGFYCGEECICECNNENSDTECISTMQSNARKLDIPFEILIQGPTCNRFVRNALQFEQNADRRRSCSAVNTARNKRSTVTIYKPSGGQKPNLTASGNALVAEMPKQEKKTSERHKRSVDHLAWFNDFTSNLVRPAPLGGIRKKVVEEPEPTVQRKRGAKTLDRTWFMEPSLQKLTRPAPLQKKQSKNAKEKSTASKIEKPRSSQSPFEQALQVVERLPRVFSDTLGSVGGGGGDYDENLVGIAQSSSSRNNKNTKDSKNRAEHPYKMNFMNPLPANDLAETLRRISQQSSLISNNLLATTTTTTPPPPPPPPPRRQPLELLPVPPQPGRMLLPWLRNRRFLRRLQQRNNNNKFF